MILSNDSGVERLIGIPAATVAMERMAGIRPSRATMFRWALSGRLECTRIGGRLFTTEPALRAMLERDARRDRPKTGRNGRLEERGRAAAARLACPSDAAPTRKGG